MARKLIYAVLALLILVGITYSLLSLMGGSSEPEATPTPSASAEPSATLGSAAKTLRSYFPIAGTTVSLRDDDSALLDFRNAVATSEPSAGQANRMIIEASWPDKSAYGFLSALTGTAPEALTSALGSDWTVLTYGQKEHFDSTGQALTSAPTEPRIVIIAEVADATAANQTLLVQRFF